MKAYPHTYRVAAAAASNGTVGLTADGLPDIRSAPPPEFDGPGGLWSPESLLVAAVADCFVLTFRAVARAARLEWSHLQCRVDGTLDRVAGVTYFCRFTTHAALSLPPGADHVKARELLERADKFCLITNSLRGERHLEIDVMDAPPR